MKSHLAASFPLHPSSFIFHPFLVSVAESPPTDRTLSASLLRLRVRQPFFGALALFARYEVTKAVPTAATDGRTIL